MNLRTIITAGILATGCISFAQPVGYQGKTLIASIGYAPGANMSAVMNASSDFIDDRVPPGEPVPYQFIHTPRIQFEAVLFDQGSFFVRFNPYNIDVQAQWYDVFYDTYHLATVASKGYMVSLGYKHYYSPTPAPLGVYWGVILTRYNYNTSIENSEHDEQAIPNEMLNYSLQATGAFGVGAMAGLHSIFWDRVTVDLTIELGYLFNNPESSMDFDPESFGGDFYFTSPMYPQTMILTNASTFFLATPSVSVGYLF